MPWLLTFLFRVASGECFRRATPTERRWYGGFFFFIPIFLFFMVRIGHSFLQTAGPVGIWCYMMAGLLILGALLLAWSRYVPAVVSVVLGVVVWGVTIWMSVTGRLI